jgi:hypothetical protein
MDFIRRIVMLTMLLLVTLTAAARGTDPIGWSLSGSLPASTPCRQR